MKTCCSTKLSSARLRRAVLIAVPLFVTVIGTAGCGSTGVPDTTPIPPSTTTSESLPPTQPNPARNMPADEAVLPATPLGAIPHADSTSFGVWAPYAQAVQVLVDGHAPVTLALVNKSADPSIATWAGTVVGAQAGDRYVYRIETDGKWANYNDPRARELTAPDNSGKSIIVSDADPPQSMKERPFKDWVIYELHIGTFNGTGTPGTYTFSGAIKRLDYLKQLGVNAIEVMPINPNIAYKPLNPPSFDWGYDPVQYDAVREDYGGPEGFKDLVNACHKRGIAVVLDVVYNHAGGTNLLNDFDGYTSSQSPNGVYFYGGAMNDTGFGKRPDFDRAEVRRYIEDSALMWLRDYSVDGLRWDSVDNIRRYQASKDQRQDIPAGAELLREVNDAIARQQPGKLEIAEDLQGWPAITAPTSANPGFGFNSQWDESMFWALHSAVAASDDSGRDMRPIASSVGLEYGNDVFHRVIYSEDHDKVGHPNDSDQARLPTVIDPSAPDSIWAKKRSTLAAAIVLTSPGIPMLFQGQEILTPGAFDFETARSVDWTRTESEAGILQMYRDLIAVRRNLGGRTAGLEGENVKVYAADNQGKTLAYYRYAKGGPGDDVIVVANFANRRGTVNTGFPRAGVWHVRFNSGSPSYDPAFKDGETSDVSATTTPADGEPCSGNVALGPYSVVILSQ